MQDREGESNRSGALVVLQRFRSVEFRAHVIGDLFVQPRFRIRQLVRNGLGDPLWKQRSAVEFQKRLLHHAAHEVRRVHGVNAVTESAFEAVAIKKRHEELEVFFFAVMRRCGHQQEVAREAR